MPGVPYIRGNLWIRLNIYVTIFNTPTLALNGQ